MEIFPINNVLLTQLKVYFFIIWNGAGIELRHTFMQKAMPMDKLLANLKARFPELSEEDIHLCVETMIGAMSAQLARGGRIELRGFGSFILNMQRPGGSVSSFVVDDNARLPEIPLVSFKPGLIIRKKLHHMRYLD